MKWHHLFLVGFVVLGLNACERHSASEYNLIKMPSEKPLPGTEAGKAPGDGTPAAESTPAKGYL